jgi:hypothetical protein
MQQRSDQTHEKEIHLYRPRQHESTQKMMAKQRPDPLIQRCDAAPVDNRDVKLDGLTSHRQRSSSITAAPAFDG